MAQRIAFVALPNTAALAWHATLVPLLAEIDRSRPGMKALKEWLRLRNLFDKDGFETLLAFLDVRPGEPVTLGPTARALLDADDEAAARQVLADRLIRENPLMAKYCLEAMDVERGGRLHSTNELYRMVTSYVYPGAKPTLNAFKAWVDWAVGAGLLKVVGIRWALGEGGREALPRLRAVDAEEFLEDEREAAAGAAAAEEEDGDEGAAEAVRAADGGTAAATPAVSATPAGSATPPATDEAPDEAPVPAAASAEPAGGPGTRRVPAAPATPRPAATRAVPAPPPAPATTAAATAPRRTPTALPPLPATWDAPPPPPAPLDLGATRDALVAWHARWPGRVAFPAPSLPAGEAGLFEAAAVALWRARGLAPADALRARDALAATGLLAEAGAGTLTLAALASATAGSPDPAARAALRSAPDLPRLHAGTRDPGLLSATEPRDLLDRLWRRLFAPDAPLAPFVLARLLLDAGRLPAALAPAAFVPAYGVRLNAFRIGFADRLHAAGFEDLVDAALDLGAAFGAPDFEAPLARVHEAYGCAFRCGRAAVCPLSCRERSEAAPGGPTEAP